MDRPSALRMALQSGEEKFRRRSETSSITNAARLHQQLLQQRRRGGSGEESRRLDSMSATTTATPWEFHEPAQPRGSSPVSRPPSVRQLHGGLNAFLSKDVGGRSSTNDSVSYESQPYGLGESEADTPAAARAGTTTGSAAAHGYREGIADGGIASISRGGIGAGARHMRSSMRAGGVSINGGRNSRATGVESSSTNRRLGSNSNVSNQAEDVMSSDSTNWRLASSSTRTLSCPSDSPYAEPGCQRDEVVPCGHISSHGGRMSRRREHDDKLDNSHNRRSSTGRLGGGGKRDSSHYEGGRNGGEAAGGRAKASPSTSPSTSAAAEVEHLLPSIDGLDVRNPAGDNQEGGGRGGRGGGGEASDPGEGERTQSSRRDREPPGSSGGGLHSGKSGGANLPGQRLVPEKETSGHFNNNDDEVDERNSISTSYNNARRGELCGTEHPGLDTSGSSGGGRMGHTGLRVSGGRSAPGGHVNSGGDVTVPGRVGNGGGGCSLQASGETAGRATSSSSSSSARECLVGLQNLGNTCFMNACLQCLLHTDAVVNLFRGRPVHHEQHLGRHNHTSPTRGALAQAFGELVEAVQASPAYSNISPAQVKRLIGKYAPHFSGYGQQDCQEFLRFFLDGLAEDLNRRGGDGNNQHHQQGGAKTTPQDGRGGGGGHCNQQQCSGPPAPPNRILSDEEVSRLTEEQQADRAWALHLARNDSEIVDIFCGQLQSRISCLSCGNLSFCFDPFFDLSLPLPSSGGETASVGGRGGSVGGSYGGKNSRSSLSAEGLRTSTTATNPTTTTLEDCLRAFSTEETLDGDNRPVCARCRRRRKSSKRLAIHRFPPVLVIHLKRFHYSSTSRTKLSTAVDFPIGCGLDLAPYSTPTALPTSSSSSGGSGGDFVAGDGHRWDRSNTTSSDARSDRKRSFRDGSGGSNGKRSSLPVYELYAVCNHMGGLQGGHYTAHCRSRSSGGIGVSVGEWHTFDDTRVSSVSTSRVGGASAYVLFYRLQY